MKTAGEQGNSKNTQKGGFKMSLIEIVLRGLGSFCLASFCFGLSFDIWLKVHYYWDNPLLFSMAKRIVRTLLYVPVGFLPLVIGVIAILQIWGI